MSINLTYAVFGLGRYGLSVAKELASSGAEVLAVDIDENVVNDAVEFIPYCKCADVTDADVIRQLGISNVDTVIIAMAGKLEESVMATMLCKDANVPNVIVKCANEMHKKILEKVGADKVVFPEKDSGTRLAKNLLSSGFIDIVELSKDVSMFETKVRDEWAGKNLVDLDLRKKYGINVVALCEGDEVTTEINPTKPLEKDMKLIVVANGEKLKKLK
ncbi:MAG: TrkA family potassium uptake protein [Ruminococcaceae bacterium]|nr:TrkA family potassium uptake protein [Oscillospiraceae bacterium]